MEMAFLKINNGDIKLAGGVEELKYNKVHVKFYERLHSFNSSFLSK